MMRVVRTDERYRSQQDGIESWHCFAAGAHYAPDNLSFGALLGCDEHLVAPGAGFDWHGHRGVDIVSWVVAGALRHEDPLGRVQNVEPGQVLVQSTGAGIRHRESNASPDEPLRLVQMTLLGGGGEPPDRLTKPPLELGDCRFTVWRCDDAAEAERWHVFVVRGSWQLGGGLLGPGDSARGAGSLAAEGNGELLVWQL